MWREEEHPRDKDGKFTEKYNQAEQIYNTVNPSKQAPKRKTKEEFFGQEHKGVKGRVAVEKLLAEKNGHIKGAFHRKEIGDIDLVWGDENGGIMHVIKRRDEMQAKGTGAIGGVEMVRKIPDIVEYGDFDIDNLDRIGLVFQSYRVAIRPTYDGLKLNWIVSAMEIKK